MDPLAIAMIPVLLGEPNFPTRSFPLAGSTERIELVDLDRDGACDVVAVQQAKLRWMQGDGTGAFVARGIVPGSEGWWLRQLADIDGDGWVDALGWLQSTGQLVQCTGNGSGGFAPPQVVGAGSLLLARCIDVDGDLDLDVVAWEYTTCSLRTFLRTSAGFVPGPVTPTGSVEVHEIAVGDFDHDQRADVALTGTTSMGVGWSLLSVFHGLGTGAFVDRWTLQLPLQPDAFVEAQLDQRGGKELVFGAESNVCAIRHAGARRYSLSTLFACDQIAPRLTDFEGDGDQDILGTRQGAVELHFNDGTGRFHETRTLWTHRWSEGTTFGDLDGDSRADVVGPVETDVIGVTLGAVDPGLAKPLVGCSRLARAAAVGDIDGDGKLDLLLEGYGFLESMHGAGDLDFAPAVRTEFEWSDLQLGASLVDFDSDGDLDAIGWSNVGQDVVATNDGTGRFAAPVALPFLSFSRPLWADFDGDGTVDALRVRHDRFVAYRGLGGGEFDSGTTTLIPSVFGTSAVADLDGDGRSDVVVRDTSGPWVRYALGPGGSFEPVEVLACAEPPDRNTLGDVNGDGRPDLVWVDVEKQSIHCLLAGTQGHFVTHIRSSAGIGSETILKTLSLSNVDRDLHVDLVAWAYDADYRHHLIVWPGRGDGTFEKVERITTPSYAGVVADLDQDGKTELVLSDVLTLRPLIVGQQ